MWPNGLLSSWVSWVALLIALALTGFLIVSAGGGGVYGTVTGPDGQPIAGCDVVILKGCGILSVVARETTDDRGRYAINVELPEEERWFWAVALHPERPITWYRFDHAQGLTLRLQEQPVTCSGVVVDGEGRPVQGAEVSGCFLWRPSKDAIILADTGLLTTTTDEEGRFAIPGFPGDGVARLMVSAEGRETLKFPRSLPSEASDMRVVLRKDVIVRGRVLHDGQPVGNMRVGLLDEAGVCRQMMRTDSEGWYHFENVTPDPFYIASDPHKMLAAQPLGPLKPPPGADLTLDPIRVQHCACIRGIVVDRATDCGIFGAMVEARPVTVSGSLTPEIQAHTHPSGEYRLFLAPGRYLVQCKGGEHVLGAIEDRPETEVTVSEGEIVGGVNFVVDARPEPGASAHDYRRAMRTRSRM